MEDIQLKFAEMRAFSLSAYLEHRKELLEHQARAKAQQAFEEGQRKLLNIAKTQLNSLDCILKLSKAQYLEFFQASSFLQPGSILPPGLQYFEQQQNPPATPGAQSLTSGDAGSVGGDSTTTQPRPSVGTDTAVVIAGAAALIGTTAFIAAVNGYAVGKRARIVRDSVGAIHKHWKENGVEKSVSIGSGILIAPGLVLTCFHVLTGDDEKLNEQGAKKLVEQMTITFNVTKEAPQMTDATEVEEQKEHQLLPDELVTLRFRPDVLFFSSYDHDQAEMRRVQNNQREEGKDQPGLFLQDWALIAVDTDVQGKKSMTSAQFQLARKRWQRSLAKKGRHPYNVHVIGTLNTDSVFYNPGPVAMPLGPHQLRGFPDASSSVGYQHDTRPQFSGGAICNEKWKIVGIHRGKHMERGECNEGIPIHMILFEVWKQKSNPTKNNLCLQANEDLFSRQLRVRGDFDKLFQHSMK